MSPQPQWQAKMGSAHILDLCSFPSLSSIQIHRIELSCCLPFFHHLLFELRLWVHTIVHCYTLSFTFCCMFCINLLSLYDSSLSPTTCVLLVSHLFVCFIWGSHQASVAVLQLQIWKDGVVKYLPSSQEFSGGWEKCIACVYHLAACCAFEELSEKKLSGCCLLILL